jgi:hypothetical protein
MSPEAMSPEAMLPEAVSVVPEAVSASVEAVSAEPDHDARPGELPRRELVIARGEARRPVEAVAPVPLQQAAARRAFADDLSAFSQGIQDALAARGITRGLVSATSDGAVIEEGMQS